MDKWFIMLGKDDPKGKKQKAPSCDVEAPLAGLFQIVIRKHRFLKTTVSESLTGSAMGRTGNKRSLEGSSGEEPRHKVFQQILCRCL